MQTLKVYIKAWRQNSNPLHWLVAQNKDHTFEFPCNPLHYKKSLMIEHSTWEMFARKQFCICKILHVCKIPREFHMEAADELWKGVFGRYFCRFSDEGWRAVIGLPIECVNSLYQRVQQHSSADDLLMTLNWLKEYRCFTAMSCTWNYNQDTISRKIWQILPILDACLPLISIINPAEFW